MGGEWYIIRILGEVRDTARYEKETDSGVFTVSQVLRFVNRSTARRHSSWSAVL